MKRNIEDGEVDTRPGSNERKIRTEILDSKQTKVTAVPKLNLDQINLISNKLNKQKPSESQRVSQTPQLQLKIGKKLNEQPSKVNSNEEADCTPQLTNRSANNRKIQVASLTRNSLKEDTDSPRHKQQNSVITTPQFLAEMLQLVKKIKYGELILEEKSLSVIPLPLLCQRPEFHCLTRLNLQNNQIIELDGEFCSSLVQLQVLNLSKNKIKVICKQVNKLVRLQKLYLDENQLINVPEELCEIGSLEELTLSNNRLTQLPSNLCNLKRVQVLWLNNNQIEALPESLGNVISLRKLHIHSNKFTSFNRNFWQLTELEEISLEWFSYSKPPKPKCVKKSESPTIFTSLQNLCQLLVKHQKEECDVLTFLENYSDSTFDVNYIDNRLRTPLHNCAVKGDIGVLVGLLKNKLANPNILDKDQCTPLCLAIREGNTEVAKILIQNENVDVNLGGGIFGSPLHLAVVRLEIWLIEALIRRKADVNKTDCDGKTPLHFVMNLFNKIPHKCAFITELLVSNGANVNQMDADNWTALHTAVRKSQDQGVQTIIKLNQTLIPERNLEKFDLNCVGGVHEWTALHLAAHGGHLDIVRALVEAGADIFQRNLHNQLPRHCAKGNYNLTKFCKMCEQKPIFRELDISSEYQLIIGQQIHLPRGENNAHLQMPLSQVQQGRSYTQFIKTIEQVKKHRPFKNDIDLLPKISQPEDTFEFSPSPGSENEDKLQKKRDRNQIMMIRDLTINLVRAQSYQEQSATQIMKLAPLTRQVLEEQTEHFYCQLPGTDLRQHKNKIFHPDKQPINLFFLTDVLLKTDSQIIDKLIAIAKLKRFCHLEVFKLAVQPILTKQCFQNKITETLIQTELIKTVGSTEHHTLLKPLQLLVSGKVLHHKVIVQACAAIHNLLIKKQIWQKSQNQSTRIERLRPGNDQSSSRIQKPISMQATPSPGKHCKKEVPFGLPRKHMFPQSTKSQSELSAQSDKVVSRI